MDSTRAWTEEMKKRKFIKGLNPKIALLIYMSDSDDLAKAIKYVTYA